MSSWDENYDLHAKKRKNQALLNAKKEEQTLAEVYEMIRDASSKETARAIQDSESPTALDQKRIIRLLVRKGWSKNEITYECQRIFGNDVLIKPEKLEDDRMPISKYKRFIMFSIFGAYYLLRKAKQGQMKTALKNAKAVSQNLNQQDKLKTTEHQKIVEEAESLNHLKEDVFKKLHMK
ncbi:UNKNOWN [Stylonychia lemnae]|uniref:CcmH/CycL/Ccl2/NrfF N-terminal domain-containing protein n=1 Tax=Stylonychia lemnae TaxID=5949 RepID=A0A078AA64_STYLE|nr:UNKNOWN [Stylonychia lemnae]|eukprot:CDW78447.1 UNKNOWN [Stylonychia lemnae]